MSIHDTTKADIQRIEETLRALNQAVSIADIEQALPYPIDRRTLQRRLAAMNHVNVMGKGRATRYTLDNKPDEDITLSPLGQAQNIQVSRATSKRTPVGYNRVFLAEYIPNQSVYFNEAELKKLADIGTATGNVQPAGTYTQDVLNRLLIDLSWNSSRLEGNTYSLLDTQRLLNFGEAAEEKSTTEAQMILNHKDAIEFLVSNAADIGFNRYTVLNLHGMLANNLLPDSTAVGRLRHIGVGIAHSVFEPLANPQEIEEHFDLILQKAAAIENPFEQALFTMVQLPYLQPFDDVNKRVSRLSANIPLLKHSLAPLSFVDVPEKLYINATLAVYELNKIDLLKDVFIWAYERSALRYAAIRQSLGKPDPFRLKYRDILQKIIPLVVNTPMNLKTASTAVQQAADKFAEPADRTRFIDLLETELLGLHEGNFARYRITPEAFRTWQAVWSKN